VSWWCCAASVCAQGELLKLEDDDDDDDDDQDNEDGTEVAAAADGSKHQAAASVAAANGAEPSSLLLSEQVKPRSGLPPLMINLSERWVGRPGATGGGEGVQLLALWKSVMRLNTGRSSYNGQLADWDRLLALSSIAQL